MQEDVEEGAGLKWSIGVEPSSLRREEEEGQGEEEEGGSIWRSGERAKG